MKKTFIIIFLSLLSFAATNLSANDKCINVKGVKEKLKCVKAKYENFRENASKTGVETIEKLNKKK